MNLRRLVFFTFITGAMLVAARATRTATTAGADVLTYHNDNARTGQNLNEQ